MYQNKTALEPSAPFENPAPLLTQPVQLNSSYKKDP